MKFSIKDFFSKCDQIRRKMQIWSNLLKKSLMENFIFCAVSAETVFPALISRNKSDDAFSFSYFIRRLADVIHNGDRLLWSWLVEEELIKIKSGPNYPNNPNFSNPP